MGNRIDIEDNLVIERYNELKNIKKVAISFGVSTRPIKRILDKNKILLTNRRYNVNHSYFEVIDNEEKAYWLGFLFADGCVRKTKSGSQLILKLSIKDEEHLNLFKKNIESEHKIVYAESKVITKNNVLSVSNNCSLRINSNELVEKIINQGCVPRKTFTIERPKINDNLVRHFIRGFYDGDGNFFYSEKTKMSVMTIVCASDKFRQFLIEVMSSISGIGKIHLDEKKYTIKLVNVEGIMNFLSYIYDDSSVELKRKKEYYEKYREYRERVESNYKRGLRGSYVKTSGK
jgi:DNA-binding transcriptional regulator WhiA